MGILILKVIIFSIIGYFIATLSHELGHVICGLLNKWKLFLLVVGPFKLYRDEMEKPLKFGIEKNPVYWCGVGGTFPPSPSEKNLDTFARVLLAGPLTSLILGAVILLFAIPTNNLFLLLAGAESVVIGIVCIVPSKMKTGILFTDGTRFKRIRGGGKGRTEEAAIFGLIEIEQFEGNDPDYPEELILPLVESDTPELRYFGFYYRWCNAKKHGDAECMKMQEDNMEQLKSKVSKTVAAMCPADDNNDKNMK